MTNLNKKLFMIVSVMALSGALTGCSCSGNAHHQKPQQHQWAHQANKHHQPNMQSQQISETVIFYQTYDDSDIDNVSAKMYTRSSRGGESKMGTIKFTETNDGLHMKTDLIDLRPGVTYTAHIYQCGACNDSTCCDTAPMAVDLPQLKIDTVGRLQKSYIIRGLTAAQLNNAKLILTREGGYKAAWGTLRQ